MLDSGDTVPAPEINKPIITPEDEDELKDLSDEEAPMPDLAGRPRLTGRGKYATMTDEELNAAYLKLKKDLGREDEDLDEEDYDDELDEDEREPRDSSYGPGPLKQEDRPSVAPS